MATKVKNTKTRTKSTIIDARSRIKPRGLVGMYKGVFVLNGTDEDVFSLNRLAKAV